MVFSTRLRGPALLLASLLVVLGLVSTGLVGQDSGPKRDAWQRPLEVLDALGVAPGSAVADVGSGPGYFTFHMAERVGPQGKVYAVEIDRTDLEKLRERAQGENLVQVETVLGERDDPRLPPATLDAALIVNAYHEMRDYDSMLTAIFRALKPGGRLGIIDAAIAPGEKRSTYYRRHRIPKELVRDDASRNGFDFLEERPGFVRPRGDKEFYFLVFEKPAL